MLLSFGFIPAPYANSVPTHMLRGGWHQHQSMRPLRIQKWLRQPTCRQTLGAIEAVPSQCRSSRHPGLSPGTRESLTTSPQPQGQSNAAYHRCAPSPTTYTVRVARSSGSPPSTKTAAWRPRRRATHDGIATSSPTSLDVIMQISRSCRGAGGSGTASCRPAPRTLRGPRRPPPQAGTATGQR